MILPWITDPHLNFLKDDGPKKFGAIVREDHPGLNAVVITGDIGEHPDFVAILEQFAEGADVPVYFILGNHDAYGGSIKTMRHQAEAMTGAARWLVKERLVELAPGVALVGHDGWYDGRFGEPFRTKVVLNDFLVIRELRNRTQVEIVNIVRKLADTFSDEARVLLDEAIAKGYKRILFATHVPPYAQATWHRGQMSDGNFLPWMSNRSMGEMLDDVSGTHPDVEFTVICGHTHSSGRYQRAPNLLVLTGHSEYGDPRVSDTFNF